ncbi:transcriptional regulator, MerR family [Paraoerskovia marina]|uniref:Transcriptional regulator, MerR family n=1 Tax=Paraoerskovia marina TaxID=545619 RepID=A0A1H1M080_9CELL|nr:redox-sensitive transcriptional activator SoxR [Paraoerskovia marina]SDR80258.1 transcriptional regulator, MerR family [Paraoerskovia marina]
MSEGLSVSEMSARSGVTVSALHFYEREGLIRAARTPGNQRRYARDQLRRVAFIRMSQRVGLPLARIREALGTLPVDRTPSTADWRRLSAAWRAELDARIAVLHELRDDLDGCIGCGCLSVSRCALVNPDDARAAEGPGPRAVVDAIDAAGRDTSLTPGRPDGATEAPVPPTLVR